MIVPRSYHGNDVFTQEFSEINFCVGFPADRCVCFAGRSIFSSADAHVDGSHGVSVFVDRNMAVLIGFELVFYIFKSPEERFCSKNAGVCGFAFLVFVRIFIENIESNDVCFRRDTIFSRRDGRHVCPVFKIFRLLDLSADSGG